MQNVSKLFLSFLLLTGILSAQIVTIAGTDAISASRSVINNNFSFLDAKIITGNGAPGSSCTVTNVTQLYLRKDAGAVNATIYICAKTGASAYTWEGPYTTSSAGGSMTWPAGAGIAVYAGGSAWGTSLTAPTGAIVGTSDTQSLTNKTVDGVTPTIFGYLDLTSSAQTQLNAKVPGTRTVNTHALTADVVLAFSDFSGTIANSQVPVPTTGALGGVKSISCVGTGHLLDIDTTGTPHCSADAGGGGGGYAGAVSKTTNYTTVSGDSAFLVVSNGSTLTHQLPATNPGGTWWIGFANLNASNMTISRNTKTINGAASDIVIGQGQLVRVYSDGTNYIAETPVSSGAGSGISCVNGLQGTVCSLDTAVAPTKSNLTSGSNPQRLVSTSASGTTYTACPATFTGITLSVQQAFLWTNDLANTSTTPSLNVCSQGAVTLTDKVGTALTTSGASLLAAGSTHWIVNDNSNPGVCCFRVTDLPAAGYTLPTQYKTKTFEVLIGDPGSGSPALADDNDSPVSISNDLGSDMTILSVACYANAGTPTVTPILTGGTGTSILTGALTCGTASWASGTLTGTPIIHSFSSNGSTCSSTPCTADVNITTAGGTAKFAAVKVVVSY